MAFPRLQKLVDNAAAQLDEELLAGLPFTVKPPSPRRLLKLIVDHATDLNSVPDIFRGTRPQCGVPVRLDTFELIELIRDMNEEQLSFFLETDERAAPLVTKLLDIKDKDQAEFASLQRTHAAFLKRYQEAQAEFLFELHETVLQLEKNRALHPQVEQLTLELELEREAKLRFKEAAEGHVELSASRRAALSSACAQERMRGELQAKLGLSIEAAAISQAAQEVAAGHRRPYFWQGFLRGANFPRSCGPALLPPSEDIKLKLRERAAQLWELVRKTDGKAANLPGRFKDNNKAGMPYRLAAPAELKTEHPSKVYFDHFWSHAVSFSPT
ncbi:uncharacterized protein J4E92_007394 [Alternaria infectoria]|uniref:uncharacterized protein n=1 Tax=Alternaria infectoria TaxID=45303 RepID=UPI00221FB18E|nr:uncharacterized protein J4E92_007394 [Alternaria infectoria]KAI4924313.1 hypothetical protein J4E92_007394 [Alternaria infectoria]